MCRRQTRKSSDNAGAELLRSKVADLDFALVHLTLAMDPRIGIAARLADNAETSRLHATTCAIGTDIAETGAAFEHSLKRIGFTRLEGVDLINIALESFAVLQRHHGVGAWVFMDGFGEGLD